MMSIRIIIPLPISANSFKSASVNRANFRIFRMCWTLMRQLIAFSLSLNDSGRAQRFSYTVFGTLSSRDVSSLTSKSSVVAIVALFSFFFFFFFNSQEVTCSSSVDSFVVHTNLNLTESKIRYFSGKVKFQFILTICNDYFLQCVKPKHHNYKQMQWLQRISLSTLECTIFKM